MITKNKRSLNANYHNYTNVSDYDIFDVDVKEVFWDTYKYDFYYTNHNMLLLKSTDNITSQLGCIASDNFIYENKTQSVAIKLDEFNVFLFC